MVIELDTLFHALARSSPSAAPAGARDLLVYLHIPFCRYRCTFCDWVSHIPSRELLARGEIHDRYVEALCRQIADVGPRLAAMGYVVRLVYWGGGTPTVLEPRHYASVRRALTDAFDLGDVAEHSLEATPDTLTVEKVRALKDLGIQRISVGVQSMDPVQLRKSGRGHTPDRVREAAEILHAEGLDNFNLDVMLGLPDQTAEAAAEMIAACLALEPAHVTLYAYRPTTGTQLAAVIKRGGRQPPSNAVLLDAFREGHALLGAAGYTEYMTGYFAKSPASRFRGEKYYFELEGDFVGFGAGANSLLRHHQFETTRDSVGAFIDNPLVFSSCEKFSLDAIDVILRKLRLCILTEEGVNYDRFKRVFGLDFAEVRRHPLCEGYIKYFRSCGAEFVDDGERFYVHPSTRTHAHLRSYGLSAEYQTVLSASR